MDSFVNSGGYLDSNCDVQKKYFKTLNDLYLWAKHEVEDLKLFEATKIFCINRSKNTMESQLPENNHKKVIKSKI